MMKFTINYGGNFTHITIEDTALIGNRFGNSIGHMIVSEAELRIAIKEYLRQRAVYRRQLRFVDPCDA